MKILELSIIHYQGKPTDCHQKERQFERIYLGYSVSLKEGFSFPLLHLFTFYFIILTLLILQFNDSFVLRCPERYYCKF